EMVKTGKADVLGYFANEDNAVGAEGIDITKNYMTLNSTVMRNKYAAFYDNRSVAAVINGSTASRNIKHGSVVYFDTYEECLKAVDEGKADYTRLSVAVLEHLYMRDYYTNITPVVDSPKVYLALGINADRDTQLYSILTKGLVNLTDEQTSKILSK
ncbi:MAG: transporter substrate-binding domain-containing protein, partial [Acidaminococcaceae bacterium]|nr:transporter substrate-binding domain-containing protein [Acidaminococcaceae bacterium]